jgi:hypothetical protein
MYYEVDCSKFDEAEREWDYGIGMIWDHVKKHENKLSNPILIMSSQASYYYESSDYGSDFNDYNHWVSVKQCERGYYADFYVCSSLAGFCFMIVHDKGVDLINFINFVGKEKGE